MIPDAPPPPPPHAVEVQIGALADGTPVWRVPFEGPPLARVELSLRRDGPVTGGLAALSALWELGTRSHPGDAWARAVDALGARIDAGCGSQRCWIDVDAPSEVMPAAVALAAELVREPRLEGIGALRREWRREWRADVFAPDRVTDLALGRRTFADGHPLRRDRDAAFFRDMRHARREWAALLAGASAGIVVIGRADPAPLGPFPGTSPPPDPAPPTLVPGVLLVDLPGESVARIRLAWEGPGRDASDAGAWALALRALGGDFTGRLNRRLRETLGVTYGIYAAHMDAPRWGLSTVEVEVPADQVAVALQEIATQLDRPVLDHAEVDAVRRAWFVEAAQETRAGIARPLSYEWVAGLPPADTSRRIDTLLDVSTAAVNQAAQRWLGGARVWVVAGDVEVLEPSLWGTPFEPEAIWAACRAVGTC